MSAGMPCPLSMKFMLATSRCRTAPMVNCRTERVCSTMVGFRHVRHQPRRHSSARSGWPAPACSGLPPPLRHARIVVAPEGDLGWPLRFEQPHDPFDHVVDVHRSEVRFVVGAENPIHQRAQPVGLLDDDARVFALFVGAKLPAPEVAPRRECRRGGFFTSWASPRASLRVVSCSDTCRSSWSIRRNRSWGRNSTSSSVSESGSME